MKKSILTILSLSMLLTMVGCSLPIPGLQQIESLFNPTENVPVETPELFGDWQVYESNGVQISLPNTYVLGDVEKDLAKLLDSVQSMSERGAVVIRQILDQLQADFVLWAWTGESFSNPETGMAILKMDMFAKMPLGIISTLTGTVLGKESDSFEKEQLTLGDHEVLRFKTSAAIDGKPATAVIYMLKDSGELWVIGFFSRQEDFNLETAGFDTAVASFRVLSAE